ncbi:MAG: ABC transporter permease [Planctomycetota bacterium]|jgi:hypothetical protein
MSTLKLLLAEIRYRKVNFVLSLLAVTVAVTLFVAAPLVIDGYSRQTDALLANMEEETRQETAKLEEEIRQRTAELEDKTRQTMRDMGFNLLIVAKETDMSDFWSDDFAKHTMPQEYIERLANAPSLTKVTHLVATLQEKIDWQQGDIARKVILAGHLPETPQSHKPQTEFAKRMAKLKPKKVPMGENIEPGTLYLGYELGAGLKEGDTVEVRGESFRVARIEPEKGSKDDITIEMHLSDAQRILKKPERINQILALECKCQVGDLPEIRRQLEGVLPEARVTEHGSIAFARAKQRDDVARAGAMQVQQVKDAGAKARDDMKNNRQTQQERMEWLARGSTSLVVVACGVWVGLLALLNVRERRTEIGILRALGKRSGTIAGLFLGKAVLLGVLGAAVGFGLGTVLANGLAESVFGVQLGSFAVRYDALLFALSGAPLLSAAASYPPTMLALKQDPAVVLKDH